MPKANRDENELKFQVPMTTTKCFLDKLFLFAILPNELLLPGGRGDGVLSIVGYTGRLPPKVVNFSSSQYIKGLGKLPF